MLAFYNLGLRQYKDVGFFKLMFQSVVFNGILGPPEATHTTGVLLSL